MVNLANEHERLQWREKLGEVLSEKTLYVSEVILQISIKKKSEFGLENFKHSMCQKYFFVIMKLFIKSLCESKVFFWRSLLPFMCQNLLLQKGNFVSQVMNKYEFVPKMPNSSDLELVFDTSFHDVQPHLFKVLLVGLKVEVLTFFAGLPQHC